jgi:hypothetical protein
MSSRSRNKPSETVIDEGLSAKSRIDCVKVFKNAKGQPVMEIDTAKGSMTWRFTHVLWMMPTG